MTVTIVLSCPNGHTQEYTFEARALLADLSRGTLCSGVRPATHRGRPLWRTKSRCGAVWRPPSGRTSGTNWNDVQGVAPRDRYPSPLSRTPDALAARPRGGPDAPRLDSLRHDENVTATQTRPATTQIVCPFCGLLLLSVLLCAAPTCHLTPIVTQKLRRHRLFARHAEQRISLIPALLQLRNTIEAFRLACDTLRRSELLSNGSGEASPYLSHPTTNGDK